ncbi:hypothetical protein B9479_002914 [Cryptococcus floricola]|uniref:Leucine repeat containing protein n=1 Tax=Cryptococcus floricola TaxID=2591691 RepID=A0A5D3B2D5_9TREE|nr:hypothetical protein B9479_002914 [Cryptococcus floricola]
MATIPGWATDELGEEWPESSPSPPPTAKHHPVPSLKTNPDSIRAKRGSLRMLGQAAARPLPPSRSASGASASEPKRIVSGHVDEGRGHVTGTGLDVGVLSPPSSRASSDGKPEPVAGTFVVKEGVDDDRGAHLARNGMGVKGKDIFGALPLERMFDPPSPAAADVKAEPAQTTEPSTSPESAPPTPATKATEPPRRASHQYAPLNPSRLSKSVTPSSNDSFTTTTSSAPSRSTTPIPAPSREHEGEDSLLRDSTIIRSDIDDSAFGGDFVTAPQGEESRNEIQYAGSQGISIQSYASSTRVREESPFSAPGASYQFTFESPHQPSQNAQFNLDGSPFDPERDAAADGPSHSTLNFRSRPLPSAIAGLAAGPSSGQTPINPALRLFRSTYDTFTREHLSAMVDSIAIEPSPSPPSIPSVRGLREWSPAADNSASPSQPSSASRAGSTPSTVSSDARSSKRLRLSPASPPARRAPLRDWAAQGAAMIGKLRGVDASTDGGSVSGFSGNEAQEGNTVDYVSSPSPPVQAPPPAKSDSDRGTQSDRPTHRSNPSSTSSGYLQAAADIMARIKQRKVSESASDSPHIHGALTESDDNRVWEEEAGRYAMAKGKGKVGPSPRRILRHLSASEEVKRAREEETDSDDEGEQIQVSQVSRASYASHTSSVNRQPPRYLEERRPTSQASSVDDAGGPHIPQPPQFNADDLNRYMSSSTHATTTTALSTSFVKHRGPRAAPPTPSAMRMIHPDEVRDVVPDRIGKMRYDRVGMRWVRELGAVDEAGESRLTGSEESVDVFAGMESLAAEERSRSVVPQQAAPVDLQPLDESIIEHDRELRENADDEQSLVGRPERSAVTSSSSSEDDQEVLQHHGDITNVVQDGEEDESGSESDVDEPTVRPQAVPLQTSPQRPLHHVHSAPAMMTPTPSAFAPRPMRSALRNVNGGSATPAPGPKKRQGWSDEATPMPAGRGATPASSQRRSVSFSDGKKAGKIVDVEVEIKMARWTAKAQDEEEDLFRGDGISGEKSFLPSARTKRIQGLLENMGDLTLADETPSKPPSRYVEKSDRPSSRNSLANSSRQSHSLANSSDSESTVPIRSFRNRSSAGPRNTADATFLTECSFGVAHDRLVEMITDAEPFNPHWEKLKSINLKGKGADSVARLKEFLPNLDEANLDDNAIGYLSGIPSSVRTLHVAGNRLTSLTSVNHLRNLQYLDISGNKLDSVAQLSCLIHLRELKADNNGISDLSGILDMDCLIKVSCANNKLEGLDLSSSRWSKLESLNVSNNSITFIKDLHQLSSAASINLDANQLDVLAPSKPMPNVRVLRFSDNEVSHFDASLFPKIRTLYADNNSLTHIARTDRHASSRLENISLRNQRAPSLRLTFADLENVRRLYVSGNPLGDDFFPPRPLYSLVYLEAAACKITAWPSNFASNMPHLKMLNLNYNYLRDLDGIKGLKELRKLTIVGGRIGGEEDSKANKDIMSGLRGVETIEELDLRMNPSTLSYYFPLLLSSSSPSSILDPSTAQPQLADQSTVAKPVAAPPALWHSYDNRFRKNLPDEWYSRRLLHRGLVMKACPQIKKLDGIVVEDGEKKKAEELLRAALVARRH